MPRSSIILWGINIYSYVRKEGDDVSHWFDFNGLFSFLWLKMSKFAKDDFFIVLKNNREIGGVSPKSLIKKEGEWNEENSGIGR